MSDTHSGLRTIELLQRQAFDYFVRETNPANGLVADGTRTDSPASIAAVGMALSAYPVGVERGLMSRDAAIAITGATLRFLQGAPQGAGPDATGHNGFFYHFLDMHTGRRANDCELSTVDTALCIAGALTAARYFDADTPDEREIRSLADTLYARVNWNWACDGGATLSQGWKPQCGFLPARWRGYNEGLILYILGLGSPTHPLPTESYVEWTSGYQWRSVLGHEYLHCAPLFTHQLSHIWLDLRDIQDAYMRDKGIDYFQNSRRAAYIQRAYAIENPGGWPGYGENAWGFTASDGPGPATKVIDHHRRHFLGYAARGVPDGPDDGSLSPWATVASLPFAPEIVLPAIGHFESLDLRNDNRYGFHATFNSAFAAAAGEADPATHPWVAPEHLGLNQGPIVLMIENHRSGLLWRLTRASDPIATGLRRAGFAGGWLGG